MHTKAFTLVELLVVIVIISVLAALLLPTVEGALREARLAACGNTHRQRYIVLMQYFQDNNFKWPDFYPSGPSGYYGNSLADTVSQYYQVAGQPSPPWNYHVYYNFGVTYHLGYFSDPTLIEDPDFENGPKGADTLTGNHVSYIGTSRLVNRVWPDVTSGPGRGLAPGKLYGAYPVYGGRAVQAMKNGDYRGSNGVAGYAKLPTWSNLNRAKRKVNPVIALCQVGVPFISFGAHDNRAINATRADGSIGRVGNIVEYRTIYRAIGVHPNETSTSNGYAQNTYTYWWGFANIWDWSDDTLGVTAEKY